MPILRSLGARHQRLVHSRRVAALARHFAELIPTRHSVLDVGCGDGLIDSLVARERPDLKIAGVDVLIRPAAHIPVAAFDGERLSFCDASWDTVLLCDVLHHSEQPVTLLQEAARVARHRVLIKDHMLEGVLAGATLRLMDFVGNAPHGVVLPYNYLTPSQWADAFRQTGLVSTDMRRKLDLYPPLADWIFGRSLHFIASCRVIAATG